MRKHESRFEQQILMYFSIAMIFVVLGIALAYSAGVTADVQEDIKQDSENYGTTSCNDVNVSGCGTAYNVSAQSLDNASTLSDKTGTLITVSVAGIIMLILVGAFFFIFTRRR